jgi:hypothetical protein
MGTTTKFHSYRDSILRILHPSKIEEVAHPSRIFGGWDRGTPTLQPAPPVPAPSSSLAPP